MVNALSMNAVTSFVAAINNYKTELEDELEEGIKLDTIYQSLKYLLDLPNLNARQARWLAFLSEYDFEIQHIKGK